MYIKVDWWAQEAKEEEKKERNWGMLGRISIACLRRSDGEMTFDRDEISNSDSLQRGEHFYRVGFSIPCLDFTIQVRVCFS